MPQSKPASHLPYDELAPTQEMAADCRAVGVNLRLEKAARKAVSTPPSLHFEDFPREVAKRDIPISEAAARLAGALHLHLD
ncbi:hypothetical protein DDE18_10155 [Nocardioides gansuensis]|uniref:Uncharacterized protein n=1 Tax=Nocardioides gansuensis TaxID=2138300 RepID=A0A2T8FAH6_9ACTN|nr:hypothetical protein [Nocardioides gansuensis]PVG82719.1 hypothetical protein DDE18_10155 [Nocardioides gansuensis]